MPQMNPMNWIFIFMCLMISMLTLSLTLFYTPFKQKISNSTNSTLMNPNFKLKW
ncbi:ATP synthase F0 subunit 8 (mitochondrion) [Galendromus occidentalis]|uniref:ATP synthase F0 subunit 8 n=1 Tax=Galendromus occidentalis TaxID=34638 RepID=A3RE59_9ACAR|nr:ATP synthase F0 subunit 8 [Galendromus occidentalis]YP_001096006.1 ATP synthase F0 subunit 8 [Galendromus occidentalis]ABN45830.1 ATPase subunit 8 [Galendromus occidentalis]ABN45841.1 ATPase subunit 8 [Galendromus occidentalis]